MRTTSKHSAKGWGGLVEYIADEPIKTLYERDKWTIDNNNYESYGREWSSTHEKIGGIT